MYMRDIGTNASTLDGVETLALMLVLGAGALVKLWLFCMMVRRTCTGVNADFKLAWRGDASAQVQGRGCCSKILSLVRPC